MAYTQQRSFDISSRPSPPNHQLSNGSSREHYAVRDGNGPRGQTANFNRSFQPGPLKQDQDTDEQVGGFFGYIPDRLNQDESYHGDTERYGGRRQNKAGGWPPSRQPQGRPIAAIGQSYNYPQNRGPPLARERYSQQDRYHHYDEPHDHQQHHLSEARYSDGGYDHDEFTLQTSGDWTQTQHYDRLPHNHDQSYHDAEWNAGYTPQDRGETYDGKVSSDTYGYDSTSRQLKVPASRFHQNQANSPRPRTPQYPNPSTNKTAQASISPNTVAWDNPFPTFPSKSRQAEHANAMNLNDSNGSMRFRDEPQQDKTYKNRSQAVSSTDSYAVSSFGKDKLGGSNCQHQSNSPSTVMWEGNINSRGGVYFDAQSQSDRGAGQHRATTQERPRAQENGRRGARVDQLKPISNGRHSEDNRTRPSLPFDVRMDISYERSQTMPTTLSEAALKHGHPIDQPAWQEPGFVASYHGPKDRGYTQTSPVNGFREGLFTQSNAYADQARPPKLDAAAHAQSTGTPPHAQKDSLAEFFDTYYDASPDDHQPYVCSKDRQHQLPADEAIPHFDSGVPPLSDGRSDGRRQRLTTDNHLQPHARNQEFPPALVHLREDVRRDHRRDPPSDLRHPRSRSQPNSKERRYPRPPPGDGFDFGVPGAPNRPPASAPVLDEHGSSANGVLTSPVASLDQDHLFRQYRGQTPLNGYRYDDHTVTTPPASGPGQNAMNDQDNGSNDRYRLPPIQSGRPRQMGPSGDRSSPINNRTRQMPPPTKLPPNPDALPSHPAPIRPGLIQSGPVNQASKPIPLRQYNPNHSTTQPSSPTKAPRTSPSVSAKRESMPVTHQELERLKQATAKNPEDQKTQLLLAKRMVEAASVLIDERSDPRMRSKIREKYILEAYKIVKKLSNNGYSEATFFMADAYSRGSLGLESDNREAFKLYQSAAKAGHAQAAYRVAVCCEIGHEEGGGTSRDAVKAMQWYKRAATLGDTPAMYKMGIISLKGLLGQPKNSKEAVIWLKRAAERADEENPHALHELALLHEKPTSDEDALRDEAYSKQLFAEAADLGYKFSQFRLGCAYEYGLMGCPVDPRQSIAWYSKAAVQEEHQSELALSGWYLTGSEGVLQQSDTEAYLWARKAAQSGLAKAEYAMGYFTEVGIGAPANLEDAKRWYWKSASQGFEKARSRLEELKRGNPVKQKTRVSRSAMRKNSEGECIVM